MKYMGRRFSDMSGFEKSAATKGLMAKFTAIAGWRIPDGDEEYRVVFEDQLKKWVHENCSNMTLSELEYAVRKYGVDIADWGRPMHLGLLAECVEKYLSFRLAVSAEEEQKSKTTHTAQKATKTEELTNEPVDWSKEWNELKIKAKNGEIYKTFIPVYLYDWILRVGKLEQEPSEVFKELKIFHYKRVAEKYKGEMEVALVNGYPGGDGPVEAKRRLELLRAAIESNKWKAVISDEMLNTTLSNLSKQSIVIEVLTEEIREENEINQSKTA